MDIETLDQLRKNGLKPSVMCCCVNNKRVLMLYKKDYGIWMVPQTSIKNKEVVEDAIKREITEEMGTEFMENVVPDFAYIGEDQVEFSPTKTDLEDMTTDSGEIVKVKGKKYYIYALAYLKEDFDLGKTIFDEYFWLQYKPAQFLARRIYQSGKRRVLLKVLDLLKEADLID